MWRGAEEGGLHPPYVTGPSNAGSRTSVIQRRGFKPLDRYHKSPDDGRCQGAPDPSRVGACQIDAGDQPLGLHRQALVGRDRDAADQRTNGNIRHRYCWPAANRSAKPGLGLHGRFSNPLQATAAGQGIDRFPRLTCRSTGLQGERNGSGIIRTMSRQNREDLGPRRTRTSLRLRPQGRSGNKPMSGSPRPISHDLARDGSLPIDPQPSGRQPDLLARPGSVARLNPSRRRDRAVSWSLSQEQHDAASSARASQPTRDKINFGFP